jgi:hypothetical protein
MDPALARSDTLLRLAAPPVIALGLCAFAWVLWQMAPSPMGPLALAVIVGNAYVVSELLRALYAWLDRCLGWRRGYGWRLAAQLGLGALLAATYAVLLYVPLKLWLIAGGERDAVGPLHLAMIGLFALVLAALLGLAHFALRFFQHWRAAEREAAHQRREALRAELDALRAQVDPHFLFNSLNVLYGLIAEDAGRAQALLLQLADVFRYASRHAASERVPLAEELEFVAAYVELLRARHGDALVVRLPDAGDGRRWLPPLALQTLVENATKHNALDAAHPLQIEVRHEGDELVVSNSLRPRAGGAVDGGTGLSTMRRRYALVADRQPSVSTEGGRFTVRLPLLGAPA